MMKRLRTLFGVDDDLQAFAEDFVNRSSVLSGASDMRRADGAMVAVLCREGSFQVELCCTPGGLVIPPHIHPKADTIEVTIAGALRLVVNGRDPFGGLSDEKIARFNRRWGGIRLNHTDWHGTTVGEPGAMFLSIQRWVGEPKSVLTDYEGDPLGAEHQGLLAW